MTARQSFRKTARFAILLCTFAGLLTAAVYLASVPRTPNPFPPSQEVSDGEAQAILERLRGVHGLEEIYMEKDDRGRIVVYATAWVDPAAPSPVEASKQMAKEFLTAVYQSGQNIANATLLVNRNGRPLLGASLGAEAFQRTALATLANDSTEAFAQFLTSVNQDNPQHLERSTWLEIDPSAAY